MQHEEERYNERHERPQRRHERPWRERYEGQQNFRSRWEEPQPFMHDRERRDYEESRAQQQQHHQFHQNREHRQEDELREDISRHQHGFSDDHRNQQRHQEPRTWRSEDNNFNPDNQHARDRWQQHEHLPPLREQRHRGHSRRDRDWDERGW